MVESVPENISFSKEEEKILEFWNKIDAFKQCLKQSVNKPKYTFYGKRSIFKFLIVFT